VKGTVFSLKRGLGAMVAVEGKYLGLIHEGEIFKPLRSGDIVEVRISHIKEDGKLDLSLKDAPKLQLDRDGEKIFNILAKNQGRLPYNDDSSPEKIAEAFGISKSSFKKACGRLMKNGLIGMSKEGIFLLSKEESRSRMEKPQNEKQSGRGRSSTENRGIKSVRSRKESTDEKRRGR
jgi:predicted RNA-binding protein (virulence factor B family)